MLKKASTDAGTLHPVPDPLHYIDLKHGGFDKTSPSDLDKAFAKLLDSKSSDLCIFFTGASCHARTPLRRRATSYRGTRRMAPIRSSLSGIQIFSRRSKNS